MQTNKMSQGKINPLIWKMGIPMVLSMVLQAIYNVVDTIFVINSSAGTQGNEALTAAFPIQILIIAIGVGTGVGINALLSKNLGEGNEKAVSKVAGNGIFLSAVIFLVFLLFGLFGAKPYMKMMASDETVIEYGTTYLQICCCCSYGVIGYAVYERFLHSTGKTTQSMITQMAGAVTNIGLDALFILVFKWGVAGAAWATIIGQFVSLIVGMILHYTLNREIKNRVKAIVPSWEVIKAIYKIGLPAAIMQGLLAIMMFCILLIINTIGDVPTRLLMVNSFGIYYKIMQIALFACFGLSNTLITIVSFNYGMKNKERVDATVKWGVIDSVITALVITALFQILAKPIALLFGLSLPETTDSGINKDDVISTVVMAIHLASISYVFMGFSVGIQGILQGLRNVYKPVIISLLRLLVFVLPFAYLFTLTQNVSVSFWWTFLIAESLTAVISFFLLRGSLKHLDYSKQDRLHQIITISRTHGSGGKEIGRRLASSLSYSFYDKTNYYESEKEDIQSEVYQSKNLNSEAIVAQAEQLKKLAKKENILIVGRAADYILRDEHPIRIFIKASMDYRVKRTMSLYQDTEEQAEKHIRESDEARKRYYESVSGKVFGDKDNYDIYLDASQGIDEAVQMILNQIQNR